MTKAQLTRENFIKATGIFVSHDYFSFIKDEFEEQTGSITQFVKKWMDKNDVLTCDTDSAKAIKFIINDDLISGICNLDDTDLEDRTTLDIISDLSEECNRLRGKYEKTTLELKEVYSQLIEALKSNRELNLDMGDQLKSSATFFKISAN